MDCAEGYYAHLAVPKAGMLLDGEAGLAAEQALERLNHSAASLAVNRPQPAR